MRFRSLVQMGVLLLLAGSLHLVQGSVAGVHFKEPLDFSCYGYAPDGWYEATQATARWTGVPPRLECDLLNRRTGETTRWDSGTSTLVPWLLMWVALMGVVFLVLRETASVISRRRGRDDAISARAATTD